MLTELLIVAVLILLSVVIVVLLRLYGKIGAASVDYETVKGVFATCWKELGIDQDIGAIKQRANDIQEAAHKLETLFKVVRGRGAYGEFQLEQILKDLLPPTYVHIREKIPKLGKIPDAHIVTPQGIICIDSKFPLENYRRMIETKNEEQRKKYANDFRDDVKKHIEKIRNDYVKPEEGTTNFAFGFIPSEAVYQYLTECEPELLAQAATQGVLLVSPATLAVNLNLLAVSLRAIEITEKAQQIQNNLSKLSVALQELEREWNILYGHIQNAYTKASDVDQKQARLKMAYQQITEQEE
ncbi:MAG: DNA recombination protein RmuC [Candidatus Bathyarchaeia archaeon]